MIILPANTLSTGGYEVANSVRFNDGDSPSLKDGDGSAPSGTRTKFTWSIWFKRGTLGTTQTLGAASYSSSDEGYFQINSDDKFEWDSTESADGNLITNRVFRDCSAWYNVIIAVDTSQGTAANRMKIYVNGTQETSFATETYPDEDRGVYWNVGGTYYPWIGRKHGGEYFDGYIAEVALIDNQQLAATSFGEFDEDSPTIWKPKDLTDLTFGTSGYWLDMEDSSAFGNDVSGVGNHFGTVANLAATDQTTDTPTNNFATLNPLDHYYNATTSTGGTLSEGSTKFVIASGNKGFARSTIGVTAGKWYWECKLHAVSKGFLGVCNNEILVKDSTPQDNAIYLYEATPDFRSGSQILTTGVASISTNDIMNFALDMDNHAFYIGVNNSWMNSGDPTSGSSRTGAISELFTTGRTIISDSGEMFANLLNTSTSGGINTSMNFGCPAYANSSDAADANGYGAFEFAPPSEYYALCTKNLAEYGG